MTTRLFNSCYRASICWKLLRRAPSPDSLRRIQIQSLRMQLSMPIRPRRAQFALTSRNVSRAPGLRAYQRLNQTLKRAPSPEHPPKPFHRRLLNVLVFCLVTHSLGLSPQQLEKSRRARRARQSQWEKETGRTIELPWWERLLDFTVSWVRISEDYKTRSEVFFSLW